MKPKLALAVLSVASTYSTTAFTNPALATASQNSPKPIALIYQPTESESLIQAEKLDQWEKPLHQRLGLNTEFFARSACSSTVSRCPDADDSDVDYC